MNIKFLDSWLRDYLETTATAKQIAEKLSLTSVSVERVEKYNEDFIYDIEITTNRPDLFSVIGIAREAAGILPQFGIKAEFNPPTLVKNNSNIKLPIKIISDPDLVNRVLAVSMDITISPSQKLITERLETSGIRSLNNVIDITNYVMRVLGHPTHVFDYDRLNAKSITIREGRKDEQIQTLDDKIYSLKGGEIIAVNDQNEIVDLLGIMGLSNSVVTNETKKILFFIDNNDETHMRKASMGLSIRTEAATINEKGIDSELSMDALNYGISLFKKYADAKNISEVIDIYPNKPAGKSITVPINKINKVIGVEVNINNIISSLETLGFKTTLQENRVEVKVPTFRLNDISLEEDIIEEIARIYGYHNLPSILPPLNKTIIPYNATNDFYWEQKLKQAMKYLGFTETYTYSFISENMFEGPLENAVTIANPLTNDFVYMRNNLIPSLLQVVNENKTKQDIKIFEIANVYIKQKNKLPEEILYFAGIIKSPKINFFEVKGLIEGILNDLGIQNIIYKPSPKTDMGSEIFIGNDKLGEIEMLDSNIIDFELNFNLIIKNATNKKAFKPFAKFPPIVEDITIIVDKNISTQEIVDTIKKQSLLITEVALKDTFNDSRTFHIVFQDTEKNLTKEDIIKPKEEITNSLSKKFKAAIK